MMAYGLDRNVSLLQTSLYSFNHFFVQLFSGSNSKISPLTITLYHGVRHGFKIGGAKTIIELESDPKFNINLYKII